MKTTDHNLQRVEQAMDAMKRAMTGAREWLGEGLQLTRTQLEILLMLVESPQTTSDLAKRLFLTHSAVTQTIDTLVRRSLVERQPDDHDRRIVWLRVSQSGQEFTNNLRAMRRKYMNSLMAKLTPEEVEALISITEKFTDVFEETKSAPRET